MKAGEIADILEEFAPVGSAEEWDNPGFCVGSPLQEVKGVTVAFDCTADVVDDAVKNGCDMVVTHHPLIFRGIKKIYPEDPVGNTIGMAIRNGVAVYAAHTNADKAEGGVNTLMAGRMGLKDMSSLDESGIGLVGTLPSEMDCGGFIDMLMKAFSLQHIRYSDPVNCMIRRVALCSGSGGSLIGSALASGAQAYVTGDVSYHEFFCPDNFLIADIGHFESEIGIVDKIIEILKENLHNFVIRKSDRINNPIHYR
ncbi:MAG: Nif3-like dinuclear metal center hexameric protein [Bacteroidales bacterium]|jgi:dinuclear metal center YbgI/SA1388 family protein|nr:Nif3-like dinuclear metal center hexameric protein [Bacteroidales bacterium]MCI2122482.1 Nif3-like dinuclear metal center hexameric protein [Bacteroidales bacterium]MCI2146252.1 Nif3-like dinuclear metal center hexameric protein [Bacteroidales bacterium]